MEEMQLSGVLEVRLTQTVLVDFPVVVVVVVLLNL